MSIIIESARNGLVESRHRLSVAAVTVDGALVASSGDPDLVTFMRSAAKPFQAIPLVVDGVVERFWMTTEELALACASHSSEKRQVDLVRAFLERIGCTERDLACGPHPPLSRELAITDSGDTKDTSDDRTSSSPLASNCSGKHAGMLALALHHGWEPAGYHEGDHPVQRRVKREIARYTGLAEGDIGEARDGCGVTAFSMPLSKMALGFARLAADTDEGEGARAIASAMLAHPDLVAGRRRLCTELMQRYPKIVLAKVGASGVYGATLMDRKLGIVLKVEDGNARAAIVGLVRVLEQLEIQPSPSSILPQFAELPMLNTRGQRVGEMRAVGRLSFV